LACSVAPKAFLTALLDGWHSSGLANGDGVARGINAVDSTGRPADTLAAAGTDALLTTWQQLTGGTRAATPLTAGGLLAIDILESDV
jgi:hypothetical protein